MKRKISHSRYTGLLIFSLLLLLPLTGCSNTKSDKQQSLKVNNVQELAGKSIGVQLGTTGDSYASDYESDDAGTIIDRYNKGNDAIQALKQNKLDAVIAFGLNSAAYVAEIVRSGILSIDNGQFEAGRSLGLNFTQTMCYIVLPQAFKNVLPALANEFIVLIKETSISGYIGLADLTKGGDIIRSITYEALLPLLAVACIYLIIVMALSAGVHKLERRLANDGK